MLHFSAVRLVIALTCATLASVAFAESRNHPFEAQIAVVETLTFTGAAPCFAYSSLQGSGHAAGIGNVTVTSLDCVNPQATFDASRPNSNPFSFSSTPTGMVFTLPSGDQIYAMYSGTTAPHGNGPERITGQFVVTGGTGKYFAATGGGMICGDEDLSQVVAAHGSMTIVGLLNY